MVSFNPRLLLKGLCLYRVKGVGLVVVRGITDDFYYLIPGRKGDVEEFIRSCLRKGSVFVVYGDTITTLAGALTAVKAGFRVAHVEAGLRVHNLSMQEEINRRVVDHISHNLFAPTRSALENLEKESVLSAKYLTGDVYVDVLMR